MKKSPPRKPAKASATVKPQPGSQRLRPAPTAPKSSPTAPPTGLKEAISRVKAALSSKGMGAYLDHFMLHKNEVLATDGRCTAGAPCNLDVSCIAPGAELCNLVERLQEPIEVTQQEVSIKLRSGRLHGTLPTLPTDSVTFTRPSGKWAKAPDGFVEALKTIRPFIAESAPNNWALCACLRKDGIVATNNIVVIKAQCDVAFEGLLPVWAVDFILGAKGILKSVIFTEAFACFLWDDGSWLRTQLVGDTFHESVETMLNAVPLLKKMNAIEADWNAALKPVLELSESIVSITAEKVLGGTPLSKVEQEMESAVEEVHFNPKFLTPVLSVATHWLLSEYPKPVPFRGEGVKGLVMGRQK